MIKKVWKYVLPIFFLVLLCLRIYSNAINPSYLAKREILVLLLLCLIFLFNNKITWCIGISLFTYGLYTIFGRDSASWTPTTMFFTEPIIYAFLNPCGKFRIFERVVRLIPMFFYIIAFISFFIKPVRRNYGWKW